MHGQFMVTLLSISGGGEHIDRQRNEGVRLDIPILQEGGGHVVVPVAVEALEVVVVLSVPGVL